MNWVDVAWPLVASMGLVLGLAHVAVWWAQGERVHLALAIAAGSLAALAVLERLALASSSPAEVAAAVRWMHVPALFLVSALVCAVHLAFGEGVPWLGGAAVVLRALGLVLNFTTGVNLHFLHIERIDWSSWWGVRIGEPVGPPNPALGLVLLSNLLLVAFLVQTLVAGLRRPAVRRQPLLVVCGAAIVLGVVLTGATLSRLLGLPRVPLILAAVLVLVLLLVIGLQLGSELIRWRRLEGLLRDSESRRLYAERELDLAALTSGLGLWHWDVAGRTFTQNVNNRVLLGEATVAANEEPCGMQVVTSAVDDAASALFARVEPAESATIRQRFEEAIRQSSYEFEYPVRGAGGGRQWVCLRGSAEHDARGAPTRVRGLTQDVSRRRSEQEQVRAVLDASPTALLLVDPDGIVRYANDRAAAVFGHARGEIAGMEVARLVPGPIGAGGPGDAVAVPRDAAGNRLAIRNGGGQFPVEVVANPLQLGGQPHVVAAVNDLTEKQRAEQEIAFERESMAHMSRVTLIGELSGSLAHELNQPLAAILSNAQAAQRILRRDPGEVANIREILEDIVENDRRAGEVISRLRGLLRKECRSFAPVLVNDLVHDSIRIIRNDLINRSVEYRLDLGVPIHRVQGDPVQLQQVLLNLIINACDAMAGGNRRVLTILVASPIAGRVVIEVRDTGPGIAAGRLETVFDPFHTTKPNGMGMGLAICRTLLGAHGGRIWAENLPGGGASFRIELPLME